MSTGPKTPKKRSVHAAKRESVHVRFKSVRAALLSAKKKTLEGGDGCAQLIRMGVGEGRRMGDILVEAKPLINQALKLSEEMLPLLVQVRSSLMRKAD